MKTNSCRKCGNNEFFSKKVAANGGYGPALLPDSRAQAPVWALFMKSTFPTEGGDREDRKC